MPRTENNICAQVERAAQHCNDKRLAAKRVGEASAELFLAVFVSSCGPLTRPGVVTGVMDHSVDVLITGQCASVLKHFLFVEKYFLSVAANDVSSF